MSNLSAFMRANVQQIENHKYVASPAFGGRMASRGVGNLLHFR